MLFCTLVPEAFFKYYLVFGSQRFVPRKKNYKKRFASQNLPIKSKAPAKRSQHVVTLLGDMLRAFGHRVATFWVLLAPVWKSNLSLQHPTSCNMSQQGGQTYATCCAQQCYDMLRWHVAIVWPGLKRKPLGPG